jgi:hypothetical protein
MGVKREGGRERRREGGRERRREGERERGREGDYGGNSESLKQRNGGTEWISIGAYFDHVQTLSIADSAEPSS